MPRGIVFWTPARIAQLRAYAEKGHSATEVAHLFDGAISYETVRVKARELQIPLRRSMRECFDGWWTASRDDVLRAAWAKRNPALSLAEIAVELGGVLSANLVAKRAARLGLPPRRGMIGATKEAMIGDGIIDRLDAEREKARVRAATPAFTNPVVTGCPFIEPVSPIRRCGAGEGGYCEKHRARVMPIPKGPMGHGSIGGGANIVVRNPSRRYA